MSATTHAIPSPRKEIDYPRLVLISAGHLTNDLYGGMITALVPYLVLAGKITTAASGFVLLGYLLGSSVLQPIFGLASDRSGRRLFAAGGPLIVGLCAGAEGWVSNTVLLFLIVAIAGIGTSAFHPQAASMVNLLSTRSKGWAMSIFSMGGNIGFAVGPVAAATVATIGLHWAAVAVIPGFFVCALLARYTPDPAAPRDQLDPEAISSLVRRAWRPLSLIVSVIATRSAVQFGMILFLPLFFHARGMPPQLGSYYAFVLSAAGALGGLFGGTASDRWGRKRVVVGTLIVSAPLLYAALLSPVWLVWPLLALGGACLIASNSVTVVQGQEWLPTNTGIASGLTLGLGFGLSGILASSLTTLAAHVGVSTVTMLVPGLAWVAALLGALIPAGPPRARPQATLACSAQG